MREKGFSYNSILKLIPVAKSTLSRWLRSVKLAKRQRQKLTQKREAARQKGLESLRRKRITTTKQLKETARQEIGRIGPRELFLLGCALYWAEGSKQKETNVSESVRFSNSDPLMINLMVKWFRDVCGISPDAMKFEIYLHQTADREKARRYWAESTGLPIQYFQSVLWKKHKISTVRKNIADGYHGLVRMTIRRSTNLNRTIAGWIEGIYHNSFPWAVAKR